jgi:hypothetical protein
MRTTRSVNPVATDERRREVNLFDNRCALHLVYPGHEIVIQLANPFGNWEHGHLPLDSCLL